MWTKYKLSDFAEINPKVALSRNGTYSFVEMKDLDEGRKYAYPSQERELTGGARFEDGDTLFARITPCLENGKICQVKSLKDGLGFGSTEFLVLRGRPGISDSHFVYYLCRSDVVRRYAQQNMVGTSGRQRVNKDAFEQLELLLPDLPTQTSIAGILSCLDDKIELNNQINQNLEALAQAIFKRWFVDFEFPNENGQPYKSSGGEMVESELGPIPKGWTSSTIGAVTKIVTKGTTPTTIGGRFVEKNGINFIKVESITDAGEFIGSKFAQIDQETNQLLKRSQIMEGDVLFSIAGTIGRVAVATSSILPANTNQAIAIVRSETLDRNYLRLLMKSQIIQTQASSNIVQAVQANLSLSLIKSSRFVLPSEHVLELFATGTSDLFQEVESLRNENQLITSLRDTLLPRLISGGIVLHTPKDNLQPA